MGRPLRDSGTLWEGSQNCTAAAVATGEYRADGTYGGARRCPDADRVALCFSLEALEDHGAVLHQHGRACALDEMREQQKEKGRRHRAAAKQSVRLQMYDFKKAHGLSVQRGTLGRRCVSSGHRTERD
jgi:hypothetical protein